MLIRTISLNPAARTPPFSLRLRIGCRNGYRGIEDSNKKINQDDGVFELPVLKGDVRLFGNHPIFMTAGDVDGTKELIVVFIM